MKKVYIITFLIFGIALFLALNIGASSVHLFALAPEKAAILWKIRLPRVLLGLVCGGILSVVGVVFQGLLNNPLADPYIIGVSSGGALGSIVAIVLGCGFLAPVTGFIMAVVAVFLVFWLGSGKNGIWQTHLILSGIVVGLFFSALISFVMALHAEEYHKLLHVLLGDLGHMFSPAEKLVLPWLGGLSLLALICLWYFCADLDVLASGEKAAHSLGIDIKTLRNILFWTSAFLVSVVVSFCGIIGFVGLIVPHFFRLIVGPSHRRLLVLSFLGGASFLMLADMLARSLMEVELPVGVITSLIGVPVFAVLLRKQNN